MRRKPVSNTAQQIQPNCGSGKQKQGRQNHVAHIHRALRVATKSKPNYGGVEQKVPLGAIASPSAPDLQPHGQSPRTASLCGLQTMLTLQPNAQEKLLLRSVPVPERPRASRAPRLTRGSAGATAGSAAGWSSHRSTRVVRVGGECRAPWQRLPAAGRNPCDW
jgi:hypothetical protein